jgi:nucleotide-binding universal stress UspA family protein
MFDTVVVGATDSEGATRAVRRAIELTRVSGGTLHVVLASRRRRRVPVTHDRRVHDGGLDPDVTLLDQFGRMAAQASVRVQLHPLDTAPAEAITTVASEEGADLIVVGSKHERGGTRQLSPVPRAVMDAAPCAVMVV